MKKIKFYSILTVLISIALVIFALIKYYNPIYPNAIGPNVSVVNLDTLDNEFEQMKEHGFLNPTGTISTKEI